MWDVPGILVSPVWRTHALGACVVGVLAGCGQRGPLFIPTGPEAAERATLVETLMRPSGTGASPAARQAPAASTAAPVKQP